MRKKFLLTWVEMFKFFILIPIAVGLVIMGIVFPVMWLFMHGWPVMGCVVVALLVPLIFTLLERVGG